MMNNPWLDCLAKEILAVTSDAAVPLEMAMAWSDFLSRRSRQFELLSELHTVHDDVMGAIGVDLFGQVCITARYPTLSAEDPEALRETRLVASLDNAMLDLGHALAAAAQKAKEQRRAVVIGWPQCFASRTSRKHEPAGSHVFFLAACYCTIRTGTFSLQQQIASGE